MLKEPLISDSFAQEILPRDSGHPRDSSGLLLGLMNLHKRAEATAQGAAGGDSLSGLISKGVLRSLMSALHFRDVATVAHSRRVALLATGISKHLGWQSGQTKLLEVASLLHDIGKVGVPDNILFKPGKLSPDESELMALHHNIGIDVLQACRVDREVVKIIVQAAQHYHGYIGRTRPVGANVCQGARILAVADAYDSLATDKTYRQAKPHDEILTILKNASGSQFDGNIVRTLERWSANEGPAFFEAFDDPNQAMQTPRSAHPEDAHEAGVLGHIFSYLYLLESLYDGFYLVDSDLRFVLWNRGAEKVLGHDAYDILGQTWTSGLLGYADKRGASLEDGSAPLKQVIESGRPATQNVQIRVIDGKWIDVEMQSVPLVDVDGQLHGVAEIFRDLSRNSVRPREYRDLKLAASRDSLTSLANRGELENQLALMLHEHSVKSEPFSLIFADIDHFKAINDTLGHQVGDQVLVDVATSLQNEVSSGDLVARYGGEEFVIVCPSCELEQAVKRAERLRVSIMNGSIGGIPDLRVTASFGVAEIEQGDTVEGLVSRADQALYQAKNTGRNRSVAMTSEEIEAEKELVEQQTASTDPFVHETVFHACIAADMIVYKLGGFVSDEKGALCEVSASRAVIRLGRGGLWSLFSKAANLPVSVVVEFGGEKVMPSRKQKSASKQVAIKVRIEPNAWWPEVDAFQARANGVLRVLRSYFAAG